MYKTSLPTSTFVHTPTPSVRPLEFLDSPRAKGKRGVKINRDPDYAYILVSRTDMAQYSGTQSAEIRRLQGRRARFPPQGVHLNHYYGVHDQVLVVTPEAVSIFVHGRTGTLY